MKKIFPYCFLIMFAAWNVNSVSAQYETIFDLVGEEILGKVEGIEEEIEENEEPTDSIEFTFIDPAVLFDSLPQPPVNDKIVNLSFVPRVFAGYRKIHGIPEFSKRDFNQGLKGIEIINGDEIKLDTELPIDSITGEDFDLLVEQQIVPELIPEPVEEDNGLPNIIDYQRPQWFENALRLRSAQEDLQYASMIDNPMSIEYAYWDLPVPPVLLVEDRSFLAFLHKQEVPEVNPSDAILPDIEIKKKHWLHKVGALLQFSQAYVSPNWYQGGNSYLSMLFQFNWNVTLNQVYHPKLLFQSDLNYKLAFTSNPSGYRHKYTISEDNFQYNLNAGLKAIKNWYYSFNLQFKTQLFNNFDQNSDVRTASFLSPGDLNMGIGMSYNHKNKYNTFQYTLTVSPLSYNLKTCISDKVDHGTYGIAPDKKTKSEIGSNLELNLDWKITANISYKTRVFMFTDYHYFLGDWQNTFSFDINKFLSTQVFVNLRYDGSVDSYGKWKKFMMREILSFGLSYTFSTKP